MNPFKRFEDITVWQTARKFAVDAAKAINASSFANHPDLKDQLLDSSASVMDIIAKGFHMPGNNQFTQSIVSAKGSIGEFLSRLYRALDMQCISGTNFQSLYDEAKKLDSDLSDFLSILGTVIT